MLFAIVLLPFILAIIIIFCGKHLQAKVGYLALSAPIICLAYFISQIKPVLNMAGDSFFLPWLSSYNINISLSLNGLSLLFALIISGVGMVVFWYAIGYLNRRERLPNFYAYLLIFMGAMLGVVCAKNLLLIYVFWELTSFSSFLLIGFWHELERPRYGAQKALFITVIGGFALFAAFTIMGVTVGSFELTDILANATTLKTSPLYPALVLLVLLGAFTKSAQVPFHIWLPDAMEAPTPISCYLHSATMVKAGIYLLVLMTPILGGRSLWYISISTVGILSLIWGAYRALKSYDLKAILANSTISQLGLVIALIGYGSEASLAAALFHLVNHSAFKGTLFLVTGMVDHATNTRDIRRLSGLAKAMPLTAIFAGLGTLAMAGLPPFNGFLSKEMFFESSLAVANGNLEGLGIFAWLFPLIAVIGSIFTFVYCMVILFRVFLKGDIPADLPHRPHEAAKSMLIPTGILASLTLIIAFFPNKFAELFLSPAVSAVTGTEADLHISFWHGFNLPLLMTVIVIILGIIIYKNFDKFRAALFRLPKIISGNAIYDWLIPGNHLAHAGERLVGTHMTGKLHNYVVFVCTFFLLLSIGTIFAKDVLLISFAGLSPVALFEILWCLVIVSACIVLLTAKKRVTAIFSLGAIGYSVAFLFIVFRAPDLALTQLLVESISLVLFFLAFRFLPKSFRDKPQKRKTKVLNAIIAALSGLMVSIIVMIAYSNKFFPSISEYYIENAKDLAGGNNIVNVTLVDFRGLDTLGEISVIALASIGVFVMIALSIKEKRAREVKPDDE